MSVPSTSAGARARPALPISAVSPRARSRSFSSGYPSVCNAGCKAVLQPFKENCDGLLTSSPIWAPIRQRIDAAWSTCPTTCSTDAAFSSYMSGLNAACCPGGVCRDGQAPTSCDATCAAVLLPLRRECFHYLDLRQEVKAIIDNVALMCPGGAGLGADVYPCFNGGACKAAPGGGHRRAQAGGLVEPFTCTCPAGFMGSNCELSDRPRVGKTIRGRYVDVGPIVPVQCDVTNFGAKGDGVADDTKAVQAAFDQCGQSGGGTVVIPAPKTFLIFSVRFTASYQELRIEEGARLLGSDDVQAWGNLADSGNGSALIEAQQLQHIAITGGGVCDGQGLAFWRAKNGKQVFRPHTVDFRGVDHGTITGPTFTNSPDHVLELGCNHCELSHINVFNPPSTDLPGYPPCVSSHTCAQNTDAVDVHGTPFYIHNVNFTTGDDNVAVHANHTLLEDSYFGTGHGASIGSMCNETITNLTVRNMTFRDTTSGCRIKTYATKNCRGHVYNVNYHDLVMYDVQDPINVDQFYESGHHPGPYRSSVQIDQITYRNITSYRGGKNKHGTVVSFDCASGLNGENNCDVSLEDVTFQGLGSNSMATGMTCSGVNGAATGLGGINDCLDHGPPAPPWRWPAPPAPPTPPPPPQPPSGTCAEQLRECGAETKCDHCAKACQKPCGKCSHQQVKDYIHETCKKT